MFFADAKRRDRFWLGLYKHKGCFFISSFLAGKEAKEAGGTYDGSPLPPFQRPTGALPLSVDPAQWDECPLLAGFCRNGTARATFHRRATEDIGWQGFRFWRDFRGRMDYRRYGAGVAFLIQLLEEGGVVEGAGQSLCFSFNENGKSMRKAIAKRESVR